jgi:hypothetical protein
MIRKSGYRFSLATNAKPVGAEIMLKLGIDHTQTKKPARDDLILGGPALI